MKNIEDILNETRRSDNPFRVPDGYFAQLQQNVMDALPEETPKVVEMKPRRWLRPAIMTAAASVCVAVFGLSLWFHKAASPTTVTLAESTEFHEMLSDYDGAADYLMVDNADIYTYVVQQ